MSRSGSSKSSKAQTENAVVKFYRDTRDEIVKVTWPTREEGIRLTGIVLIVTLISAIALFGVDTLFGSIIGFLIRAV